MLAVQIGSLIVIESCIPVLAISSSACCRRICLRISWIRRKESRTECFPRISSSQTVKLN